MARLLLAHLSSSGRVHNFSGNGGRDDCRTLRPGVPRLGCAEAAPRRIASYCIVDLVVGMIRVTTIADRSRQSVTRGAMLFFQWSLS